MKRFSRDLFARANPIALGALLVFLGSHTLASAQSAGMDPSDAATAGHGMRNTGSNARLLNGFAETLRPRIKRPALLQNTPYQPIKKVDDQAQIPEIEMFVGESRVFPTPGVARIAVGNGQILTAAALDNKEVILFANGVGTSSLFVWNDDGRYQRVKINILPGDTTRFAREIAAFLTTIPNAKASIIGDKVIVEGDNLSDIDLARIDELAKHYPQIVNFTNRLGWEQMVVMDVKVVEFPVNELRELGLKWNAMGGAAVGGIWSPAGRGTQGGLQIGIQTGQGNPIPITNSDGSTTGIPVPSGLNVLSAINLGLGAQLNLLEQNGKAAILAEPQLSARNGAKATFLAGGEYPYTVSTINGPTVLFKPYGVKLEIVPHVDRTGVIRATVDSEVSAIDSSVSTPSGPALSTRRTNTEFNVRNGETLVLSGLLSRKTSSNLDKLPFLGDIPVLGALFRSKRFQNDETELVVFVTPRVVDSRSPGMVDRVERTTRRLQEEWGKPPYLSSPVQPEHDPARYDQASPSPQNAVQGIAPPLSGATPVKPAISAHARPALMKPVETAALSVSANPFQADATYTASTDLDSTSAGSVLQVTVEGLIVHARPNAQSTALLQLGRGSVVHMTAVDPKRSGGQTWRHVRVGNITGWVPGEGVAPSRLLPLNEPNSRSAIARPDQQGPAVGLGNPGIRVREAASRAATANLSEASEDDAAVPKRYRVALEDLALRVTPDVNAPVLAQLSKGTVVEALAQPAEGYWIAVEVNGKRGWAASQWLVQEQNDR